jgi:hypothetical protein
VYHSLLRCKVLRPPTVKTVFTFTYSDVPELTSCAVAIAFAIATLLFDAAAFAADSATATLPLQQQQQAPLSSEVLVTNSLGVAVTLAGVMPWSADESKRMGAQATAAAARASPRRRFYATASTTTSDGLSAAAATAASTTPAAIVAASKLKLPVATAAVPAAAPAATAAVPPPAAAAAAAAAAAVSAPAAVAAAVLEAAATAATQWHEGFLCPDCHCDLGSPDALLCHYMDEHSHSTSGNGNGSGSVSGATNSSWTHGKHCVQYLSMCVHVFAVLCHCSMFAAATRRYSHLRSCTTSDADQRTL